MAILEEQIEDEHYIIKPCSDGVSTDIKPKKKYRLNLKEIKNKDIGDVSIEILTDRLIIMYYNNIKITLYDSGRMLVDTREKDLIRDIVQKISNLDLVKKSF